MLYYDRFHFPKLELPSWSCLEGGKGARRGDNGKFYLPPGSKPTAKMGVMGDDKDPNKPALEPTGVKAKREKSDIDSSVLPALGESLGKGGSGEVYLTDRGTVLKRSLQGSLDKEEIKVAKRMGELGISPSIYSDSKNMEMENLVAKGGRSLDNLGRSLNRAEFDDLVSKVDKMHRAGVYHRDLHSGNIFVMPNNEVRIIDFGMGGMEKGIKTDDFRIVADYRAIQTHAKRGGHPIPKRISSAIEKEIASNDFDIAEFLGDDLF